MDINTSKSECPSAHSLSNKIGRVIWGLVAATVFRFSPRLCYGWRRFLLRLFGAKIGVNARISQKARIWAPWNLTVGKEASVAGDVDCYCVAPISIGDYATVSQYSFLCTASHDISSRTMKLISSRITIHAQSWVCASAFISPGVTIGEGSIVGARAVVTKSTADWTIVAGNPAKVISHRKIVED